MRGADSKQEGIFSYVSPESRIPTNHPLRPIRALLLQVLYAIRSERMFGADIARDLFESIIAQAHATGLLSDEHWDFGR